MPDMAAKVIARARSDGHQFLRDLGAALSDTPWSLLAALTLVAVVVRATYVQMPMRQDESLTVTAFALAPWRGTVGDYAVPNNHILHSILVKLSLGVFGNGPWQVRLPAFVFGVLIVPATWFVGENGHSRPAATVAALGAAVLSPLVLFSANARGYSMITLFFLVQYLAARHAVRTNSLVSWCLVALLGALGMFTNPTMAYPFGAIVIWALSSLGARREGNRERAIALTATVGASAVMTLALYGYAMRQGGWRLLLENDAVQPSSFAEMTDRMRELTQRLAISWSTGLPGWLAIVMLLVALAGLARGAVVRSGNQRTLPAIAIAFAFVFSIVLRRVPVFPRVFLFLTPLLLVTYAEAWSDSIARAPRRLAVVGWALAVAPFLVLGVGHLASRPVADMTETGWFPDAAAVAQKLETLLKPGDQIAAFWTEKDPVRYYLLLAGGTAPFVGPAGPTTAGKLFLVLNNQQPIETVLKQQNVPLSWATRFTVAASFPNSKLLVISVPASAG